MIDLKYNLLKHPNIHYTEDGGAAPYDYTAADNALDDLPGAPENYELLDMDDFLPAEAGRNKANHTKNSEAQMKLNHNQKKIRENFSQPVYAVRRHGVRHYFCPTRLCCSDPLVVVENLSTFIFSLIRAVGLILLGGALCRSVCLCRATTPASAAKVS